MKLKIVLLLILPLPAFVPLRAAPETPWWSPLSPGKGDPGVAQVGGSIDESDKSDDVRVDVVVDMTDAGKKVERPTREKPAYYLPLPMGYKEFGYAPFFKRPPPPEGEVQSMLQTALSQQGYELMSKHNHPSIMLSFWWGYMAPPGAGTQQFAQMKPGAANGANPLDPNNQALVTSIARESAEAAVGTASDALMIQLLAGDSLGFETHPLDPRQMEVLSMRHQPRYYILVSAFDFDSWVKNLKKTRRGRPVVDKPILLWRAHISTELWGHYFDQVAQTLITAGAVWFGRETHGPQLATTPLIPTGRVIVGTPEVKDYSASSGTPSSTQKQ